MSRWRQDKPNPKAPGPAPAAPPGATHGCPPAGRRTGTAARARAPRQPARDEEPRAEWTTGWPRANRGRCVGWCSRRSRGPGPPDPLPGGRVSSGLQPSLRSQGIASPRRPFLAVGPPDEPHRAERPALTAVLDRHLVLRPSTRDRAEASPGPAPACPALPGPGCGLTGVACSEPGMARRVGAASGPLGPAKPLPSHQGDSPGSRQNN